MIKNEARLPALFCFRIALTLIKVREPETLFRRDLTGLRAPEFLNVIFHSLADNLGDGFPGNLRNGEDILHQSFRNQSNHSL